MFSSTLYVKNEKEELVGCVSLDHCVEKIVVDTYTKDEHVLNASTTFPIKSTDENDAKFVGFAKYLRDRKKAAVAKISSCHTMYILPPAKGDKYNCLQYYSSDREVTQSRAPPSQTAPRNTSTEKPATQGDGGLLSSLLAKVRYRFVTDNTP